MKTENVSVGIRHVTGEGGSERKNRRWWIKSGRRGTEGEKEEGERGAKKTEEEWRREERGPGRKKEMGRDGKEYRETSWTSIRAQFQE